MAQKPLIKNPADIKLNEFDEIQQILGHPPGWFLRWGITLIVVVVLIFGTIANFIAYPDTIEAKAILTTENPPVRMVARQGGTIQQLFIDDKAEVKAGDFLALINSTIELEDFLALSTVLDSIQLNRPEDLANVAISNPYDIGNLQPKLAAFNQSVSQLQFLLRFNEAAQQVRAIQAQITHLEALNKTLQRKETLFQEDIELAASNVIRFDTLLKLKSASERQLENAKSDLLDAQKAFEDGIILFQRNQATIAELQEKQLAIRQKDRAAKNSALLEVQERYQSLRGAMKEWRQNYLIEAPIAGNVDLSKNWSAEQYVSIEEEVLTIIPIEGAGAIVAKAALPSSRSGKVLVGQKVQLRMDGFPYREFGVLNGEVSTISDVPLTENGQVSIYTAFIHLKNGLQTTYDEPITFRQEMPCTALILTESKTLLHRIFERLYDLMYNRPE